MAGFYAWQLTRKSTASRIRAREGSRRVRRCGLWDRWVSEEDDVIESVTLISVAANELVSGIAGPIWGCHPSCGAGLCDLAAGRSARRSSGAAAVSGEVDAAYAVSPRVNSSVADDPA